jgi:hypothetical protein
MVSRRHLLKLVHVTDLHINSLRKIALTSKVHQARIAKSRYLSIPEMRGQAIRNIGNSEITLPGNSNTVVFQEIS